MKKMNNKDVPYERQMLPILRRYDNLVEENKALKKKIKQMEEFVKFGADDNCETPRKHLLSWIRKTIIEELIRHRVLFYEKAETKKLVMRLIEEYNRKEENV